MNVLGSSATAFDGFRTAAALRRPWMRSFLRAPLGETVLRDRLSLVVRFYAATRGIRSVHSMDEMLRITAFLLDFPLTTEGRIVEAGTFKGGSAAKLSLVAEMTGRKLVVFDSFQGIPANEEEHGRTIAGRKVRFREGHYTGTLDEVRNNVARYGVLSRCEFRPGWFEDSMPKFKEPVVAAYIDVDLASSTRTCLKHLYPLLVPGGRIFSQDGHLPLVLQVLEDNEFWEQEVGFPKPRMEGLGERKLVEIFKD